MDESNYTPAQLEKDTNEAFEVRSRQLESMLKNSGNPIYAFEMLVACQDYAMHAKTRSDVKPWEIDPLSPPIWVTRYLVWAAQRIREAAGGLDPDTYPSRDKSTDEEWHEQYETWRRTPSMTPEEAVQKLGRLLSLARPGWNAFSDYRSHKGRFFDLMTYEYAREQGASDAEAINRLMEDGNFANERTVRRRIAQARKIIGGRNPWTTGNDQRRADPTQDNAPFREE
jgi:hypothetical protein